MRTIYLVSIACGIGLFPRAVCAQENRSIDQEAVSASGKRTISVFVSGGPSFASGKMKDSGFVGNGWNLNGGIYVPMLSTGDAAKTAASFSAGVEATLSYAQQKVDGGRSVYMNNYSLQDGTITPAFSANTPHANTFQILAGPKVGWCLGKIGISPSILAGYISIKRNAYTLSGTVANPKQPAESQYIPLIAATDYTVSGFVLQPKVETGYHFTSRLSLFAAGALAFGPSVENNFTYWKPRGNAGSGNVYSYDQFASGGAKTAVFRSRWQSAAISIGLRYSWTRMPNRLSMTPTTTRQTQGKTFGEKVAGGLQSGGNAARTVDISTDTARKPGGAVSNSYAAGRVMQAGDTTRMPNRLSMTPTTTRQTQGSDFGEKVAGGLQSGGNAAELVAGNPVPGVVIKGGKNPPVRMITSTSNNNGEVILDSLKAGAYLFTLTIRGQTIGGIVVKGGKVPGTSFTNLTVNSKGQIGFEVLEAGNYKLIIEASDPNGPSLKKEKVVEKATSGLKDTLKTQV